MHPDNLNNPKYGYALNKQLLVARSDDDTEWIVESINHVAQSPDRAGALLKDNYLCVACHGESPGEDEIVDSEDKPPGSHPMMNLDGVMPDGFTKIERGEQDAPATYTKNLNLNCNSCHNTHKSDNRAGIYIMKLAEEKYDTNKDPLKINPEYSFTALCKLCHKEY